MADYKTYGLKPVGSNDRYIFANDDYMEKPLITEKAPVINIPLGVNSPLANMTVHIKPYQVLNGWDFPYHAGGYNLIPDGTDTENGYKTGYYLTADGQEGTRSFTIISEYFPVKASTMYSWKRFGEQALASSAVCFYDANKNFLSGESYDNREYFSIESPKNAAYARASIVNESKNTPIIFIYGTDLPDECPPYENVCPLTGWTGVNLEKIRKNLFYAKKPGRTTNGLTFTVDNGVLSVSGTVSSNATAAYTTASSVRLEHCMFLRKGTYTCSCPQSEIKLAVYYVDPNNESEGLKLINGGDFGVPNTFTISDDRHIFIQVIANVGTSFPTKTELKIQLELGSVSTAYEASNIEQYSFSWESEAGTVYGGTLDIKTGILTVNMACETFTKCVKLYSSGNPIAILKQYTAKPAKPGGYIPANIVSSYLKTVGSSELWEKRESCIAVRARTDVAYNQDIWAYINKCTTKAEYDAYLAAHPLQVAYELDAPQIYQLTPIEINNIIGKCAYTADAGDIEISYYKEDERDFSKAIGNVDEKAKYVDEKIHKMLTGSSESEMTASKDYMPGKLMIINNNMLRATAYIPNGGTITIGSNAEEVDLETVIAEKAEQLFVARLPFFSSDDLGNNNAGFHNSLYRGKNLGTSITNDQWAAIRDGTFEDMYIGDYWNPGKVLIIAGFDYWLGYGDSGHKCIDHHVVLVPKQTIVTDNISMNATDTTAGAYINSGFYTDSINLNESQNTIRNRTDTWLNSVIGSEHILTKREYLANAATDGYETSGGWYDSTWEMMNEIMVYGTQIFHNHIHGENACQSRTVSHSQLPLFRLNHELISIGYTYWLRDVANSAGFCCVAGNGYCALDAASHGLKFRPALAIKA